jgi:F0F1-type ATP synthase membrane subunit b/b'
MAQENYREALTFNELKNNLKLKLQNVESREIEFLYNTEKEDIKIEQLKNINYQQFKSNTMLITAISLFIILIILLWSWLKMMNRNFRNRYELISTEKREAEINLKINEERAIKSLLEKYEVLTDNRIKEIEIEGKNKEMEILLKEKEVLNNEIEAFTERINHLDKLTENKKLAGATGNTENQLIIEDLIAFLNKKLPQKPEYIELLRSLNSEYVTLLKSSFAGNLSKSYTKYCLCFVIGMEISEVSECFEIEPSSVHVLRYRLKKRFGLANSESLDEFLKKTATSITPSFTE